MLEQLTLTPTFTVWALRGQLLHHVRGYHTHGPPQITAALTPPSPSCTTPTADKHNSPCRRRCAGSNTRGCGRGCVGRRDWRLPVVGMLPSAAGVGEVGGGAGGMCGAREGGGAMEKGCCCWGAAIC
jgi:hypothetical protein